MPLAATWMDKLDRDREITYEIPYAQNPKRNYTDELIYKTETDLEKKLMVAGGKEGRKGQLGSLGWSGTHCYI